MKKKNGLYISAISVLACSIITKIMGMYYRIKLGSVISASGMAYIQSVHPFFAFFLMLSISGMPVAVAKLCSENKSSARRIYISGLYFYTVFSIFITSVILLLSKQIESFIGIEDSGIMLCIMSPSVIFATISALRHGYLDSMGKVMSEPLCGILEQSIKIFLGLKLAEKLYEKSPFYASLGAVFVSTLSDFFAMLYFFLWKDDNKTDERIIPKLSDYMEIARLSLPVTVSACIMPIASSVDTFFVIRILGKSIGNNNAATFLGILTGMVMPLVSIPGMLISSLSGIFVPKISRNNANGNAQGLKKYINTLMKLSVVFGVAVFIGMILFGETTIRILYKNMTENELDIAVELIKMLSPSVLISSVTQAINIIMQGTDRFDSMLKAIIIGTGIKIISNIILCNLYGIYGTAVSNLIYQIVILISLILTYMRKHNCVGNTV